MTTAISVRCQHCGAPLQIGESLRFVTCNYCHAELEVVRDASTIHTEVLSKIEATTDAMTGQLKVIEIQNELERLDREWEQWKQGNLVHYKDGSLDEPGPPMKPDTLFWGCVALGVILEVIAFVWSSSGPGYLLGPVAFVVAWCFGKMQNTEARRYESSLNRYEKLRTAYLLQLESARAHK